MLKSYAGIGSRDTPVDVCERMTQYAAILSGLGYTLNSGGAKRADEAFEAGAGAGAKQIFLPYDGFNRKKVDGREYAVPEFRPDLVEKYHPNPDALSVNGWLYMSRNCYQVLGKDLVTPVEFVVCWTKDGKPSGGTGQALRIAKDYNILMFNLNGQQEEFESYLERMKIFG